MENTKNNIKVQLRGWKLVVLISVLALIAFLFLPVTQIDDPTCTVLYSSDNHLLGARLGADEQWRFPQCDSVPERFEKALLLFEDRHFYQHPGVNPAAIFRAIKQNIQSGEIVSGASTITMQVVRISRSGKERNVWQKLIEALLALRLELAKSKTEILKMYASNAPFGGNVVGIDAAAWRYFGRSPDQLSWAEAAMLAVLPNAPSLIFPGKNQDLLRAKRDRLLHRMYQEGYFDALSLQLALQETLPLKPHALPMEAPHLLDHFARKEQGRSVSTTIDYQLQRRCNALAIKHIKQLKFNEIHNLSLLVLDVHTSEVLAYVGNVPGKTSENHGTDVDVIQAPRSSGSILKPLLYAACLNDGEFLPHALIPDVPIYLKGFAPKNYNLSNEGAVMASQALSRSLNVPAVHMLRAYSSIKFHHLLKYLDFSTIKFSAEHYGLSLILGGAEVSLWDLCRVYKGMANTLVHVSAGDVYPDAAYASPFFESQESDFPEDAKRVFGAASIYQTFEAMKHVNRPGSETGWESFSSTYPIAWKTGTSYGYRDAWAVGVTPEYVVGVWAGNADGEGRPELTGVTAAAPIMFDIFDVLKPEEQFNKPYDELFPARVCRESGFLASPYCPHVDTIEVALAGLNSKPCPYHHMVHLDPTGRYQVSSACCDPADMLHKPWFVLPPAMAWYYQKKHSSYQALPAFKPGCAEGAVHGVIDILYPEAGAQIYVPKEMSGKRGMVVFEALHQRTDAQLFWHLDQSYLTSTQGRHQVAIQPLPGKHSLLLMDEDGNTIHRTFTILNKP